MESQSGVEIPADSLFVSGTLETKHKQLVCEHTKDEAGRSFK